MDNKLDLAWGAKAIAQEIGVTASQAHYLLQNRLIRCAQKRGKK